MRMVIVVPIYSFVRDLRCSSTFFSNLVVLGVEGAASRKVLSFVLVDLLKNIVQDGLGIIGVLNVSTDSKNVSTLFDIVFEIIIGALVGKLGHFNPKEEQKRLDNERKYLLLGSELLV
jgi:uncharacterized membrane protein